MARLVSPSRDFSEGHHETIEDVLNRLRAEFLEMPGLRLKFDQVQRLCGVERTICQMVLDLLVDEEFIIHIPRRQTLEPTSVPRRLRDAAGKGRLVFHREWKPSAPPGLRLVSHKSMRITVTL